VSIPDAGPAVEYSNVEATFDKSSSSKNSGSESEEAVELKSAKEVRNLERVDGATKTVPGGIGAGEEWAELETRVPIQGGKVPEGLLGQIAGNRGLFDSEIRASWGDVIG
jgi:hypothetical protein